MSAKILNLDAVAPEVQKSIVLNGVEHPHVEIDVETFIKQTRRAREIDAEHGDKIPLDVLMQVSIDMIAAAFPSAPREELEKLNFRQIAAIRAMLEEENEPDAETRAAAGNG